jgi:hypothetical protein
MLRSTGKRGVPLPMEKWRHAIQVRTGQNKARLSFTQFTPQEARFYCSKHNHDAETPPTKCMFRRLSGHVQRGGKEAGVSFDTIHHSVKSST